MEAALKFILALVVMSYLHHKGKQERGLTDKPWFSWGGASHAPHLVAKSGAQLRGALSAGGRGTPPHSAHPGSHLDQRREGKQLTPEEMLKAVPPDLMDQLDQLTHDHSVSERLVVWVFYQNPYRDIAWCVEKAMDDLKRDRQWR